MVEVIFGDMMEEVSKKEAEKTLKIEFLAEDLDHIEFGVPWLEDKARKGGDNVEARFFIGIC